MPQDNGQRDPDILQVDIEVPGASSGNEGEEVAVSPRRQMDKKKMILILQLVVASDPGEGKSKLDPEGAVLQGGVSTEEYRVKLNSLGVVDVRIAGLNVGTEELMLCGHFEKVTCKHPS